MCLLCVFLSVYMGKSLKIRSPRRSYSDPTESDHRIWSVNLVGFGRIGRIWSDWSDLVGSVGVAPWRGPKLDPLRIRDLFGVSLGFPKLIII